eukprot:IDg9360t1
MVSQTSKDLALFWSSCGYSIYWVDGADKLVDFYVSGTPHSGGSFLPAFSGDVVNSDGRRRVDAVSEIDEK